MIVWFFIIIIVWLFIHNSSDIFITSLCINRKKGWKGAMTRKPNRSFGAPYYYVVSFIFCVSVSYNKLQTSKCSATIVQLPVSRIALFRHLRLSEVCGLFYAGKLPFVVLIDVIYSYLQRGSNECIPQVGHKGRTVVTVSAFIGFCFSDF